jgi:hypothetical protein
MQERQKKKALKVPIFEEVCSPKIMKQNLPTLNSISPVKESVYKQKPHVMKTPERQQISEEKISRASAERICQLRDKYSPNIKKKSITPEKRVSAH